MRIAARALVAALALAPAAVRAGEERPRIAVLDGSPGVSATAAVARAAADAVLQVGAEAIAPEQVASTVAADKGDVTTCGSTPACAAATCAGLRADALLVATVRDTGRFWLVELRVREARGGWIKGQGVEAVDRDERAARDAATRLATKLVKQLVSPAAVTSTAPAPTPVAAPTGTATKTAITTPTATKTAITTPTATTSATPTSTTTPTPTATPTTTATATTSATATSPTAAPSTSRATSVPTPAPAKPTRDERLVVRDAPSSEPASARGRWGMILAASGVALLAGSAAIGGLAWAESNGASASLARGDLGSFAAGRQSSQTLAWSAAGLGGAGAVALAAGLWLRVGGRSPRVAVGIEPAGARVAVAF